MKPQPMARFHAIASDDEAYEAAGFVLDCILADGSEDDELGDSAGLRPVEISRADDGSIQYVMCAVRPCGPVTQMPQVEERVLVGAPC